MNAWIGGALAVAAMFLGGGLWGWKGVILALTGIVFWLLLQFSRLMRAMRAASESPVGQVHSAVMFNSQLRAGMTVAQIITLTRSLGRKLSDTPETFGWIDAGGDQVAVVLQKGKVQSWELLRGAENQPSQTPEQGA
ncbi:MULTISPECIES: hypothetical protein [unclassified Roseateles]|uniref:hypothetical protein n=1 Tax=unclassified Roseateles TaxID=2626991 RepID=UPI000733B5F6|nr:hypothetical protein [Paucibacter sp. KCTC 42545]ALT79133.1 hypothetical protein AT984_20015 [Paucibacter sp. KCTC 42545]MBY0236070.1 hypothetical protein [Burkholderiaceae bacterium]